MNKSFIWGIICFDLACNAGHLDIVELLIKYKANVNIQSASGNTALHYAAGGVSGRSRLIGMMKICSLGICGDCSIVIETWCKSGRNE